jgi:hypothetical protein
MSMTSTRANRRITGFAAASSLALAVALVGAPAARAGVIDIWTTYPSMSACKGDLINLNDYCFGLQDGSAIGLVDTSLAVDELDQSLGIFYEDDNALPAPEGAANPVVDVWNNTGDYTFIAPGTSPYDDAVNGIPIYYIPPHADDNGPAIDAVNVEGSNAATEVATIRRLEARSPEGENELAEALASQY